MHRREQQQLLTFCFTYVNSNCKTIFPPFSHRRYSCLWHFGKRRSCIIIPQQFRPPPLIPVHQLHSRRLITSMESINTGNDDVRARKQILRKEIRGKLKLLSSEEIDQQSRAVWNQLHSMIVYQQAKSIGLFLSMPTGEINTSFAVQHAIHAQKDIYIPQVGKNFELPDMELIQIQCRNDSNHPDDDHHLSPEPIYANWPKNKWNIPEPPENVIVKTAQPGDIDLLIVPGLAFDQYGNRLGQGKGYYDRFMARMCNTANGGTNIDDGSMAVVKSPILVAVALSCQFINDNDDNRITTDNIDVSSTAAAVANTTAIPVHEHDVPVKWIILPNRVVEIDKK